VHYFLCGMGNFAISETFRSRLMGHHSCQTRHVISRPWPLTLEGDTGDRAPYVYYGWSSQSFPFARYYTLLITALIRLMTLTFPKIFRIYCVSINRPGDLDLWPLTSKLVRFIARGVANRSTNFDVSGLFILDVWANICQTHHLTLPLDMILKVMLFVGDTGLRTPSVYPSLKFVCLPFRNILRICCLSINRPGDLDHWPCDL